MALLQVCFGGRIAESIFCDDISSGAESDIQKATHIAKQMVLTWGMSDELGPISYSPDTSYNEKFYALPAEKDYSDKTAEEIDKEVKKLIDDTYKQAEDLINKNKNELRRIANALLKYETLDADDVKLILKGGELDKPTVGDLLAAEQAKTDPPKLETKEQKKPSAN